MGSTKTPSNDLAQKVLPSGLLKAINHIFLDSSEAFCLVGGTALSGFYAGHRRSDDIDLFAKDEFAQKAAIDAVNSLEIVGAKLSARRESRQHYHCLGELEEHRFTIDVVLDPHFHSMPEFQTTVSHLRVATLEGLLSMKIGTLISRCSEKDLYDLKWLFDNFKHPSPAEFVPLGRMTDGGMSEETLLISLCGAQLKESACNFAGDMGVSARSVHETIEAFKESLIIDFSCFLQKRPGNFEMKKLMEKLKGGA